MRAATPWCTTTRRRAAFEREASAEEKDKDVEGEGEEEGEGEGDGSKMFVVESISPSSVAAFKQCPRLFYYRWDLFHQFICFCWHSIVAHLRATMSDLPRSSSVIRSV